MSQHTGPTLAHRSVASIRQGPSSGQPVPSSPHTPPRTISSTYGSPSTIRAEEDIVVVQPGSRFLRAGFAGESHPKAILQCGPDEQRRAGDFRHWLQQDENDKRDGGWAAEREIWKHNLKDVDVGLVQDKLDRTLREAFTKYLLIDSRPRRIGLVLDSALPQPLLSALLDILFTKFQSPFVTLLSAPVMTTVGAGVRSGLVVDMGWEETVVTSVYEYREVKSTRSTRGGRTLLELLYKTLCNIIGEDITTNEDADARTSAEARKISFEECEEVLYRLMWCRSSASKSSQRQSAQLETVEEQDETEVEASHTPQLMGEVSVPLSSTSPPREVQIPLEKLADTCDSAFLSPEAPSSSFDDDELPIPALIYQHLLQIPVDARATCMARIIFTGGCSNVLGLKERVFDELTSIVERRGFEPVTGKGVEQLRNNPKLKRTPTSVQTMPESAATVATATSAEKAAAEEQSTMTEEYIDGYDGATNPAVAIEAKLAKNRPSAPQVQGQLRVLQSVGPWAGASLVCQLKTVAIATVEREQWLQHGIGGASRPGDVDHKQHQRQSMGGAAAWRGGGGSSWTLGAWGQL
ncbi:actin domain-containing protein [Sarocladium implicatum]|nr:actin domain-containing protein [Sarocladium implicatum]